MSLEASNATLAQELHSSRSITTDLRTESNEAGSLIGELAARLELAEHQLAVLKLESSSASTFLLQNVVTDILCCA